MPLPFRTEPVNCWILEDDAGVWVVDTGVNIHAQDRWSDAFRQLDIDPDDVCGVIITHFHPDHIGASSVLAQMSGAPVYASAVTIEQTPGVWGDRARTYHEQVAQHLLRHGMPEQRVRDRRVLVPERALNRLGSQRREGGSADEMLGPILLSHHNLTATSDLVSDFWKLPMARGELFSFLPLCHIAERTFTTFLPLRSGAIANFAESIETVPDNVREVAPTLFFAVPRIWERFYSGIAIRMKEATWIGRTAYKWALGIGLKVAETELEGRKPGPMLKLAYRVADFLVLDNIKRALGLHRIKYAGTGAAPIAPDLIKWYRALGVDMREVYGQTENCGLATGMPDRIKLGTVGIAAPETEIRLSPEGEILLKGPHVFMGYLNQPEKTAETVRDGWLHTGDVGLLDNEGYLRITDRMKDIIITAGGKNITPSEIENQLKFSPYISDAVVIGDKRKFLSCLIMIDYENVAKYAQDNDVPFTDFASLCRAREINQLINDEIERVNRDFARVETIKQFRLIDQQLTAEDDELTPTMKLRRKFVNEKYKALIDGMYASA